MATFVKEKITGENVHQYSYQYEYSIGLYMIFNKHGIGIYNPYVVNNPMPLEEYVANKTAVDEKINAGDMIISYNGEIGDYTSKEQLIIFQDEREELKNLLPEDFQMQLEDYHDYMAKTQSDEADTEYAVHELDAEELQEFYFNILIHSLVKFMESNADMKYFVFQGDLDGFEIMLKYSPSNMTRTRYLKKDQD